MNCAIYGLPAMQSCPLTYTACYTGARSYTQYKYLPWGSHLHRCYTMVSVCTGTTPCKHLHAV